MSKSALNPEYLTYRQMEKRYFTDTSVSMYATVGARSAVGETGIAWVLDQAFLYGMETVGKRSYYLKFQFTTEIDSDVSKVKIFDGDLQVVKDNLEVAIPGYKFTGDINIKENWNGRVHVEIPDEHYICVYLPGED